MLIYFNGEVILYAMSDYERAIRPSMMALAQEDVRRQAFEQAPKFPVYYSDGRFFLPEIAHNWEKAVFSPNHGPSLDIVRNELFAPRKQEIRYSNGLVFKAYEI